MMIPANPGGGWDQTGRNLAAAMQSAKLVSGVQFDNKGGAAGTIGLAQFVNSAKGDPQRGDDRRHGDGRRHHPQQVAGEPVAGHADRAPDERMGSDRGAGELAAQDAWPTWSRRSRTNPGKVSWGGGSAGGTDHILIGLIAKAVGVDPAKINYVPFKGGGEAIAAILGGHVTAGVSGLGEFAEQIKAGKMRALAQSGAEEARGHPVAEGAEASTSSSATGAASSARPGITPQQRDALVKLVQDRDRDAGVEGDAREARLDAAGSSAATTTRSSSTRTPSASRGIIESLGLKK